MNLILDETTVINGQNSQKSTRPTTTNRTRYASLSVERKKSSSILTVVSSRRKREIQNENLQNAITELLNYFSHRNLDAIVRVIRLTLEKLRKRIHNYGRKKYLLKILYLIFLFRSKSSRSTYI